MLIRIVSVIIMIAVLNWITNNYSKSVVDTRKPTTLSRKEQKDITDIRKFVKIIKKFQAEQSKFEKKKAIKRKNCRDAKYALNPQIDCPIYQRYRYSGEDLAFAAISAAAVSSKWKPFTSGYKVDCGMYEAYKAGRRLVRRPAAVIDRYQAHLDSDIYLYLYYLPKFPNLLHNASTYLSIMRMRGFTEMYYEPMADLVDYIVHFWPRRQRALQLVIDDLMVIEQQRLTGRRHSAVEEFPPAQPTEVEQFFDTLLRSSIFSGNEPVTPQVYIPGLSDLSNFSSVLGRVNTALCDDNLDKFDEILDLTKNVLSNSADVSGIINGAIVSGFSCGSFVKEYVDKFLDLGRFFGLSKKNFVVVLILIVLCFIIKHSLEFSTKTLIAISLLVVALLLFLSQEKEIAAIFQEAIKPLLSLFSTMCTKGNDALSPQMNTDTVETAALVVIGALCFNSKTPKQGWSKLALEYLDRSQARATTLSSIFQWLLNASEWMVNKGSAYFGCESSFRFVNSRLPEVDLFCDETRAIVKDIEQNKYKFTQFNYGQVCLLMEKYVGLLRSIPSDQLSSSVRIMLQMHYRMLVDIKEQFVQSGFCGDSLRPEPVSVMMFGLPGTLKTNALEFLSSAVLHSVLSEEDLKLMGNNPSKYIFSRNAENKFWEGYDQNKMIVIFDDFGQVRDVAGDGDNEYMNFIRSYNEWPYQLHMANMNAKANTFFKSPFLFATTNRENIVPDSIFSPDALKRRFDFHFEVTIAPEFLLDPAGKPVISNVDFNKMKIGTRGVTNVTSDMFNIRYASGSLKGKTISFRDMVVEIVKLYVTKKSRFEQKVDTIDEEAFCMGSFVKEKLGLNPQLADEELELLEQEMEMMTVEVEGVPKISSKLKELMYKSYDIYKSKISAFIEKFPILSVLKWVSGATLFFGLFKFISGYFDTSFKEESVDQHLTAQMARTFDKNANDIIEKVIKANCFEFCLPRGDGSYHKAGFCTIVKDRLAMIPCHFAMRLQAKVKEYGDQYGSQRVLLKKAYSTDRSKDIYVNVSEILDSPCMSNLTVWKMTDQYYFNIPGEEKFPSIIKYFKDDEAFDTFKEQPVLLAFPTVERSEFHIVSAKANSLNKMPMREVNNLSVTYPLAKTFSYFNVATDSGDCGALLFTLDRKSASGTIVGMHVAGEPSRKEGCSVFVCKQYLELVTSRMTSSVSPQIDLPDRFVIRETLDEHTGTYPRSKIRPSRLRDTYAKSTMKPAKLAPFERDGVLIDPFKIAINKYCNNKTKIDPQLRKVAKEGYLQHMEYWPNSFDKRILTFEEAVMGIEDVPEFGSISRSSSCGYPWNKHPEFGSNKNKLFGTEQEYDLNTPGAKILRKAVDDIITKAKNGERSKVIFADCSKDERRPKAKVDAGNTRLFASGPVDYLTVWRQYFGTFAVFFTKNRIHNGSAIGVNPYSSEWNSIALELLKHSKGKKRCGAGDYSHYDGDELSDVHYDILDIINEWYNDSEENMRIRRVLWEDLTNSIHIRENVIYEWDGSLPSGHPFTAIVNTIYNNLCFRMCWLQIFGVSMRSMMDFNNNIYLICLGDDNLYSVSFPFSKEFDEFRLSKEMSKLGMTYTSEIKGDCQHGLRGLEEVEFLKRKFSFDDIACRYVAPLRMETILEMPQWSKKGERYEEITHSNIQNALDELSLHGQETYQEWAPKMLGAYYANGYREIIERTRYVINHEFVLNRLDYAGNVSTFTIDNQV